MTPLQETFACICAITIAVLLWTFHELNRPPEYWQALTQTKVCQP